jgi:hypothetical protein
MKLSAALPGALAGAALASLPGAAGIVSTALGAAAGGAAGLLLAQQRERAALLERFAPFALLAFFVPLFTMPVAPGADMAMHVALARGLLEGGALSPAWGTLHASAYPRGLAALIALLSPLGLAKAGLAASALAYVVFAMGLSATLYKMRAPWPRTVGTLAVLMSRAPQSFFDWGGNPTVLALGLGLLAAAEESRPFAALLLAGAAAVHPMGACAAALVVIALPLARRAYFEPAIPLAGLVAVLAAVALFGPHLSPSGLAWIHHYAAVEEALSPLPWRSVPRVLGDPATITSALAAAALLWKRDLRPVALAVGAVVALCALFALLQFADLYPARFGPLLLVAVTPLWGRALPAKWTALFVAAFAAAVPGHLRWYQRAEPIATPKDLQAIACVARIVPAGAVIDGAYGDATQWIPALAGRAITRPHGHWFLFKEGDAARASLPAASWRFVGERLRYDPPIAPPQGTPLCEGALYKLQ